MLKGVMVSRLGGQTSVHIASVSFCHYTSTALASLRCCSNYYSLNWIWRARYRRYRLWVTVLALHANELCWSLRWWLLNKFGVGNPLLLNYLCDARANFFLDDRAVSVRWMVRCCRVYQRQHIGYMMNHIRWGMRYAGCSWKSESMLWVYCSFYRTNTSVLSPNSQLSSPMTCDGVGCF